MNTQMIDNLNRQQLVFDSINKMKRTNGAVIKKLKISPIGSLRTPKKMSRNASKVE